MPRMPFIGVRSSWLMLARNSLLARLAASAVASACLRSAISAVSCPGALFHALLQFVVGTTQRLLSLGPFGDLRLHRTGHEVEGLGERADFIACGDRHAGAEATGGDRLCAFG